MDSQDSGVLDLGDIDINIVDEIPDEDLAADFDIEDELSRINLNPSLSQEQESEDPDQNSTSSSVKFEVTRTAVLDHNHSDLESEKDQLGPIDVIVQTTSMIENPEMSKQSNSNHDNPSDVSSSEDEAQDMHNSISSFESDSEKETVKNNTEEKSPVDSSDADNFMNQILRDTRYFLMKSNNEDNVELSKSRNVWSTPPANESKINLAVKDTRNVILIFSVKESGQFSGFARVVAQSRKDGEAVPWVLPPGLSNRTLSSTFDLDWISKKELSFTKTQHLFNPWNEGKPVKIGRDGQEIEPHVAAELCRLFPADSTVNWNKVVSRLSNSVNTRSGRISAPIGSTTPSFNSGIRRRGFPSNRRSRGNFVSPLQGSSRSFDYGRSRKRSFEDNYAPYDSRPKRGSYDSYSRGYHNMSDRYYQEPRSSFSAAPKGSQRYPDYGEFHHPPPVAPMPYPPPPPFDSLPPPPRYYDGPPIPEFAPVPAQSRLRGRRSSSPYEKSVTDFLRRAGDRPHRDHDRDNRKYYRH